MAHRVVARIIELVRQPATPRRWLAPTISVVTGLSIAVFVAACQQDDEPTAPSSSSARRAEGPLNPQLVERGQRIFRFDHFGDPTFWSDTLQMHEVIRGTIGSGVSPAAALALGLKVDLDALPEDVQAGIVAGTVDLDDPATTVVLLKLGAVLGVVGEVNESNTLTRVGITCALCHSTVDDGANWLRMVSMRLRFTLKSL